MSCWSSSIHLFLLRWDSYPMPFSAAVLIMSFSWFHTNIVSFLGIGSGRICSSNGPAYFDTFQYRTCSSHNGPSDIKILIWRDNSYRCTSRVLDGNDSSMITWSKQVDEIGMFVLQANFMNRLSFSLVISWRLRPPVVLRWRHWSRRGQELNADSRRL